MSEEPGAQSGYVDFLLSSGDGQFYRWSQNTTNVVIERYDPYMNAWSKILEMNDKLPRSADFLETPKITNICHDQMQDTLYIFVTPKTLVIVQNVSKSDNNNIFNFILENLAEDMEDMEIRLIKDELHIFGNKTKIPKKTMHWIFHIKSQKLSKIHDFDASIGRGCLCYISSQNKLLLCCGYDWTNWNYSNKFYLYDVSTKTWETLSNENENLRMHCGFVLTNDEKYLITLGGWIHPGQDSDAICVLDIDNWKWHNIEETGDDEDKNKDKKILVKCHCASSSSTANIINNIEQTDLLTNGYIRGLWRDETDFKCLDYPPMEIIRMIQSWINDEWIYLLDEHDHYKIPLKEVLGAIIENI